MWGYPTQCQTLACSMLRALVLNPRAAKYKMYTGGDTTHFLGMWLVDSFHRNIVARVLPGHGKIVKHWPVCGYKRFGDHCLSLNLSNTYCRYKRLFGTPIAYSVMCGLWKIEPIFLDLLQTFCELMIKDDFKLWWFPETSHSLTNKNSHFLLPRKGNHFYVIPNDFCREAGVFKHVKTFWCPLIWLPPQTPGLDLPLLCNLMYKDALKTHLIVTVKSHHMLKLNWDHVSNV